MRRRSSIVFTPRYDDAVNPSVMRSMRTLVLPEGATQESGGVATEPTLSPQPRPMVDAMLFARTSAN